jgi:S-adenosylmethionine:tRNA ribosyltransferase-isomerase
MAAEDPQYDISRYDYELPPERIAQRPVEPRDASRLMVLHRADGSIEHAVFRDLGRFLRAGDLLVLNDTRVFPARTIGTRSTGGKVEVFFLRDLGRGLWEAMIRAHGRPKSGEYLELEDGRLVVKLAEKTPSGQWTVLVPRTADLLKTLEQIGRTPLPPYVRRGEDRSLEREDRERYQTVYARQTGAVAAPTAGLHFTEALLQALRARGVGTAQITLHVGLGTFQPIKVADLRRHRMHAEFFSIDAEAAARIAEAKRAGGRVIAVGSTSCRALETAAASPQGFGPFQGESRLYVYPPYTFKMTDALLTNFHLPRSTLLLLVAAFAGRERILGAYQEARQSGYRFYSYGDAMLII